MYQWNARDYASNSRGQEVWAQELLQLLALEPDDCVLDIGCGDGRTTAAIAQRVTQGQVLGVDLSEDMVRHARETHSAADYPNLRFARADARVLDFDSEFSVIFSNAVLHWIRDQVPVVHGIARALEPGGRLLAQFGGHGNTREMIASFESVATRPRWREAYAGFQSTYGFYSAEQYSSWLREAGLEVIDARLIPKDMVHADRAAAVGWLRTAWHPYTSPVADADRGALIDEVVDDYLERCPPDANGAVHVAMIRLQVQARKPHVS
jgi:trans-aconitate 2-methyltransferase